MSESAFASGEAHLPPCVYCGRESESLASKRCGRCQQLELLIHTNREIAQRIVAAIMPSSHHEWPLHFPGAWQHWPQSLRDVAGVLLASYWNQSMTPADLVKTVTTSMFGENALRGIAELPPRPRLTASAAEWWPFFLLVARAQHELTHRAES